MRLGLRERLERPLARLHAWLERAGADTLGWILGIVGFLVARDAAMRLWG